MISPVNFRRNPKVITREELEQKLEQKQISAPGAAIGAVVTGGVVHQLGAGIVAEPAMMAVKSVEKKFSPEECDALRNGVKQMVKDTGLDKKGVRIKWLNPLKPGKSVMESLKDKGEKASLFENFYRKFADMQYIDTTRRGDNAFFCPTDMKLPKIRSKEYNELIAQGKADIASKKLNEKGVYIKKNSIILSKEYMPAAGYHEVGHAMNANLSKFGKFLQKSRGISMYAPMLLGLYCAFSKNSKPNEGEQLNGRQKTKNFIRKNAPALCLVASVPMLLEEGMATAKGNKFAKKVLSPDVAQRALKSNLFAYASYLAFAVFAALGVKVARDIKDNAIAKKEKEVAEALREASY